MRSKLADKSYKDLTEYVASLREDVSDLSEMIGDRAGKRGREASDRFSGTLDSFREILDGKLKTAKKSGRGMARDASDRFAAGSDDLEGRVKDNPWAALLIAGAVGMAIGFITSKAS